MYRGVSFSKRYRKWLAKIMHKGKTFFLGFFDSEILAAKMYDLAAISLKSEKAILNFSLAEYKSELAPAIITNLDPDSDIISLNWKVWLEIHVTSRYHYNSKKKSSKYRGVTWHSASKRWIARIRDDCKKLKFLGYFQSEEMAAKAYSDAQKTLEKSV